MGHHRDTTETRPLHRRDTTGTSPRHHRDTTGTQPGHQEEKRLGHRTVHSPKMDASTNINRVKSRPQTWWLLGNNTGTPPRHTTARDTTATGTPTTGTLPRQHSATPPGHHRETTRIPLGQHPHTGHDRTSTATPRHHRDTTGTPPEHHWDTTGTPLGHDHYTTATPLGHHRDTTGTQRGTTGTPPGHQEEKRLGHRTVHSPKMDASTNTNRVRSRPQTWWLLGNYAEMTGYTNSHVILTLKHLHWHRNRKATSAQKHTEATADMYSSTKFTVRTFRKVISGKNSIEMAL